MTILALGLGRLPRLAIFAVAGLLLGITDATDHFFLIFAVVMFLGQMLVWVAEIASPSKALVLLGIGGSTLVLLLISAFTMDPLPVILLPLLVASIAAGIATGLTNRAGRYRLSIWSMTPYLPATPLLWLMVEHWGVNGLIIAFSLAEGARLLILRSAWDLLPSQQYRVPEALRYVGFAALTGGVFVIDRAFAVTAGDGAVSQIAYATGAMMAVTAVCTYGAVVVAVNGAITPLRVAVLAGVAAIALAVPPMYGYSLSIGGWTADVAELSAIFMWILPAQVAAVILYGRMIAARDANSMLMAAGVLFLSNVALNAALMPFGVAGIIAATIIAHYVFVGVLWVRGQRDAQEMGAVVA